MNILVVGGAGYVGSHMVRLLVDSKISVMVLDDLSSGHKESIEGCDFVEGCLGNRKLLDEIFTSKKYDAVMHFAAYIEVGESVTDPAKYYENNCSQTLVLLDAMVKHNIRTFIFSSTAAIFGRPAYSPMSEGHPKNPINPYGRTKLIIEEAIKDYAHAYGLKYACLRYFNAAGAHPDGSIGERHDPESHLIPLVLQAASGRRKSITVFGDDYKTPDGSCLRDYVHVCDLVMAHLLALKYLHGGGQSGYFNLGNGTGFSVFEVIAIAKSISGVDFSVEISDKRGGDPAQLVADSSKAADVLSWNPEYAELETIIKHAWVWELRLKEEADGLRKVGS